MRTPLLFLVALSLLNLPGTGSAFDMSNPKLIARLTQSNAWENLTPAQQHALAPLANDWNRFPPNRKQKWLVIANKFQQLTPEEQKRAQDRMQQWVNLTPQERTAARENYLRSNKLRPNQRSQEWENYQQLSEEQKAQLGQNHAKRKNLITNLPTPTQSRREKLQPLNVPHPPNH